jgi:chromosomal replication initiation ATPase DnaA
MIDDHYVDDDKVWAEHQLWVALQAERFPPERIVQAVADAHGVTVDDLLSRCRISALAYARHHAVWELRRRRLDLSYPLIARALRRVDHTTAIHSYRTFNAAVLKGWYKAHRAAVAKALGDEA